MGQEEEWQILAEEAAQERDPEKLLEIIASLNRALDEREQRRHGNGNGDGGAVKLGAA